LNNVCFILTHGVDEYYSDYESLAINESYLDIYSKAIGNYGYNGIVYIPSLYAKGVVEIKHKFGHLIKIIPFKNHFSFIKEVFKELKRDEVDIIHYANFISRIFIKTAWLFSRGYPVIAQYSGGDLPTYLTGLKHLPSIKRMLLQTFTKLSFNKCSYFLVHEGYNVEQLRMLLKVPLRKILEFQTMVIEPEIFYERDKQGSRYELKFEGEGIHILCVSRIPMPHESLLEKNPFLLLEIFNKLIEISKSKDIYLHIVGWGPGQKELIKAIKNSNASENIFYHGKIEHSKMPLYYSACDFTFLPVGCDKIVGFTAIESFACSRPVVAFKLFDHSISNQVGGLLISPNVEKGATELLEFINSGMFDLKGKEGYEYSKKFHLLEVGKRLIEIYKSLL